MSQAREFLFPLTARSRLAQQINTIVAALFNPFLGAAASAYYGQRNARDAKRRARSQYLAGLTGRSQMFRSPVANRQVIYGRAKVSGPVLFVGTTGVAAENLYMVIALAGHEIQGFDTVWFNEEPLGLDAGGNVVAGKYFRGRTEAWDLPMGNTAGSTLTVPSTTNLQLWQEDPAPENGARTVALTLGTHYTVAGNVVTLTAPLFAGTPIRASGTRFVGTSLANVRVYTGTATQTADAELMAAFPTQWTSAHRLRGVAYAIVRLSYDQNVFQGGVPNIAFQVYGKKVFDPRSSTTVYSNNWALCVHDYLRSAEGGNFSAGEIDTASVIAAANVSDELVPLAGGGSHPRYTLDGAFELATSPEELLPDMLTAGNGSAIYQQGKWTLKAGAYSAPVLALNENDLAGGVSIVPEASAFDLFNAVKGTFIDPQRNWQPSEFPIVTNALYEAADGGERKELDLTLPYTQDATRAQRIAKQLLDRSRLALTCTAEFNLKAFRLQAGDTITLSIARYGWVNKIFMVRQREFNFATQRVTLTLQEEAAAAYNWAGGDALAYDPAPNTTLPQPWNIPAPASAAATSGNATLVRLDDGTIVPQIRVTWTQPTNVYVLRNGRTEVEYRRVVDTTWRRIEVRGDAAAAFLPDVQEASAYSIRLRHVLDNGVVSDWTILSPHTVVGKSAPPPDATSLTVTTLPSGRRRFTIGLPALPIDIDGAQIRFNSGASLGPWLSAARLGQNVRLVAGSAAGSEVVDLDAPGPGEWTFGVRLVDGSGNLSANTITTTVTLGQMFTGDLNATADIALVPNGASAVVSGNALANQGGSGLWDVAAWSRDRFFGGAAVYARTPANNRPVGFGLSADPGGSAGVLDINYWLHPTATGEVELWESGVFRGTFGTYAAGDSFAILYDGAAVRYIRNGTVLRTVAAPPGLSLGLRANARDSGARIEGLRLTAYGSGSAVTPASALVATGASSEVIGNALVKRAGTTSGWGDCGCYTREAYTGGATIRAVFRTSNAAYPSGSGGGGIGLNTDAAATSGYVDIDYWITGTTAGNVEIYESGVFRGTFGTWADGDVLSVTYDGSQVRYMRNSTVLRTLSVAGGLTLAGDVVIFDPAARIDGIEYGPYGNPNAVQPSNPLTPGNVTSLVNPNTINTREINPGAVTVVSDTKPTDVSSSRSAVGTTTTAIAALSFANTTGETQQVLVNYYALHTGTAGVTGSADATTLTRITGAVRVSGVTYTGQPAEFREFERGSLALGSNDFTQDHGGSFVVSVPTGSTATVTYEHAIINVGPGCASNVTSRGISMSLAVLKR